MSVKGLEMLRKHMAYYDFAPDRVLLLGDVLYYAKKAEVEVAELEAENAKLRKLVDYMTPIAWYAASERERDRMRELGIEVDG